MGPTYDHQNRRRTSGFYGASMRMAEIGGCILFPPQPRPHGGADDLFIPTGPPIPLAPATPSTPTVCEDGTASNQIRVKVIYYDALAVANGVYADLGATAQTAETDAAAINVQVGTTTTATAADGTVTFDNLTATTPYTITLTNFSGTGAGAAYMSIHNQCGTVHTANATSPHHRNSFQVDKGALYTIKIWLRPKSIVLHWTAGSRRNSNSVRTFYHFIVNGSGNINLGGRVADDPRFWRHNLYISGMPANTIEGLSGNHLPIHTAVGSGTRNGYGGWNAGRTAANVTNNVGYGVHAGGFNTNSIGVSICAMSNSVNEGAISAATAVTDDQADGLIEHVAALCNAWEMDATDPNTICTHFEVDHLHRTAPVHKWDITWLPEEKQDAYRTAYARELCATEADPLDHTKHIDQAVGAGYTSGETNTDRVSAYLRELINDAM